MTRVRSSPGPGPGWTGYRAYFEEEAALLSESSVKNWEGVTFTSQDEQDGKDVEKSESRALPLGM